MHSLYRSPLRQHLDKLVIYAPVTFRDQEHYRLHKLLRCIDRNIILGKLEPADYAAEDEHFRRPDDLVRAFEKYPQIIANTRSVLDSCTLDLPSGMDNNRISFTASVSDDYKLLNKLALQGLQTTLWPYKRKGSGACAQQTPSSTTSAFPLIFSSPGTSSAMPIVGDYHIGRGSGANSIVAFCLYIQTWTRLN